MKFISSFSTGKDSMLALHRMVKMGHEPVGLMVMYNSNAQRSWFHGTGDGLLEEIAKSLNIPLICGKTAGDTYNNAMEEVLKKGAAMGAEACVFGDIDIEGHRQWNEERCSNAGLKAVMPLWGEPREKLVYEVIDSGYKCVIKCISKGMLPESFLGKVLSRETVSEMRAYDVDLCGENGEYHTVVLDGPMFKTPVPYKTGDIYRFEYVTAIDIDI